MHNETMSWDSRIMSAIDWCNQPREKTRPSPWENNRGNGGGAVNGGKIIWAVRYCVSGVCVNKWMMVVPAWGCKWNAKNWTADKAFKNRSDMLKRKQTYLRGPCGWIVSRALIYWCPCYTEKCRNCSSSQGRALRHGKFRRSHRHLRDIGNIMSINLGKVLCTRNC